MGAPSHAHASPAHASPRPAPAETKKERCIKMYQAYHKKFPSVETLTSTEYLQQMNIQQQQQQQQQPESSQDIPLASALVLIDARSRAEQKVSMIPNAITLSQFESNLRRNLKHPTSRRTRGATTGTSTMNQDQQDNDPFVDPSATSEIIVIYCTIGYRSGLEAIRLRDKYNLNVKNLDGILGYTHACAQLKEDQESKAIATFSSKAIGTETNDHDDCTHSSNSTSNCNNNNSNNGVDSNCGDKYHACLIDPKTKQATTKVHVFGSAWDIASDDVQTVWFSKFDMALRGIGVGFKAFVGGISSLFRHCWYRRSG